MEQFVLNGNNIDLLKNYPDNYKKEIEEMVYITNKEGEKEKITQTLLF